MSDEAQEAFDLLRGEVTLLRRVVEGLLADPVKIPPEVSRQLRAQSAKLARLAEETKRLAESPALEVTPGVFAELVRRVANTATERFEAPWNKTLGDLKGVAAEFARYGERARSQDEQRGQLAWAVSGGAVTALAAWIALSGPIARALPERWSVAEHMAAATLDLNRWEAGQRLMGTSNQEAWKRWVWAFDLYAVNETAITRCAKRSGSKGAARRCEVELPRSQP